MKNGGNLESAPHSWRFVDKLRQIVADRGESMGAASHSIGAAYSALGQYGSRRFDRPTPEILRAIVSNWPPAHHVPLLVQHLEDELSRAGLDPSSWTIASHRNTIDCSSDAEAVLRAAMASEGWANLLAALAVLARRDATQGYASGQAIQSGIVKVAESPVTYPTPPKPRKKKSP